MMNIHSYHLLLGHLLLGAGLAMPAGTVAAQAGGDVPYPSPQKATPAQTQPLVQPVQTDAAAPPTARPPATESMAVPDGSTTPKAPAKMSDPSTAQTQAMDEPATQAQKPAKRTHHATKSASRPTPVATGGETAYQQALRQCAKERDRDRRDSCLDSAIEQFQHSG